MAAMRIFTGVKLDDAVRNTIVREMKPFKKAGGAIRWTEAGNIHLTLKFIGEADEALTARLAETLSASRFAVAPFSLRIRGFGKFPAGGGLNIFWAGVEAHPALPALFAGIEEALTPLGISRETRPFHPHLTLGRNKAGGDFQELFALLAQKQDLFQADWPVAAFQLFASRLTAAGPVYTVIKEMPLVQS